MAHGGFHSLGYSLGIYGFWHCVGFTLLGERRRIHRVCCLFSLSSLPLFFSLDAFNKLPRTFRHSFMLLAFIWMLLGRTGASVVSGEKRLFLSIPSPLSIKFGGYYGKSKSNRFLFKSVVGLAIWADAPTAQLALDDVGT